MFGGWVDGWLDKIYTISVSAEFWAGAELGDKI